jgi:AcrR family transcriptional regulator
MSVPRDRVPGRELTPYRRRLLVDERRRLLQAVVDSVVTVGYDQITVHGVCEAAGVSARRGFYRHFPDTRTAFVEACLAIDRDLRARAAAALADSAGDGPRERLHACVSAVVEFLVEDPVRAEALLVHGYAGGTEVAQARDATMARFVAQLHEIAAPGAGGGTAPDELLTLMALGGAHETIHRRIVAGELGALPAQVPELVDLLLLPFARGGPCGTGAAGPRSGAGG